MLVRTLIASYLSLTLSLMTPIILTIPSASIIANKTAQVENSEQRSHPVPFSATVSDASKNRLSLPELQKKVEGYLVKQQGEYGLYYLDLSTSSSFGVNELEAFNAASTAKVPIVLYLYMLFDEGKIKPSEQMTYQSSDWRDGSGFIRYQKVGSRYTLVELAKLALMNSDNVALAMLRRRLGADKIMAFCKRLGASLVDSGDGETSPRSMGVYLQAAYEFALRSQWGRTMVEQMVASPTKDRIPALLPEDVPVANKHGNLAGVINDVAIVLDEHPYILVILTRGVPYFDAPVALAEVSKMIYEGTGR